MIDGEAAFAVWAPEGARWSEWAKPVVFTQDGGVSSETPLAPASIDIPGLPEAWGQSALIVDLPGVESVTVGLMLAQQGFRPVPLYNGTAGPNAVLDVDALGAALGAAVSILRAHALKSDAPPAFLLDAQRMTPLGAGEPGRYDNRWIVLPQDFPSATRLLANGIKSVTVIQREGLAPAQDLAHVLRRWQDAGLTLAIIDLSTGSIDRDARIPKPSMFRLAWYAVIALMGLRRTNVGGFGAVVPESSGRSGFYG
jgi:hypothetical protein